MAIVVKAECEGEIRRLLFESTPDYDALLAGVQKLWPGCDMNRATYADEEGDACTLTDTTFEDFLCSADTSKKQPVLRLRLQLRAPVAAQTEETASEEVGGCSDAALAPAPDAAKAATGTPDCDPVQVLAQLMQAFQGSQGHFPANCSQAPYWAAGCKTSGASSSAEKTMGSSAEEDQEKVYLVLAAFDEDGDGCLNLQEFTALGKAVWGFEVPPMAYHFICGHLGVDAQVGLSADAMARGYAYSGTLELDYAAAKRKLEGVDEAFWGQDTTPAPGPEAQASNSSVDTQAPPLEGSQ